MVKAAQAASSQTALGFTFRRSPAISAIKSLMDDGRIGRPAEGRPEPIMTACVFAWEERAEESTRFMLEQLHKYTQGWATT